MSSEHVSLLSTSHLNRNVHFGDSDDDPFALPSRPSSNKPHKGKKSSNQPASSQYAFNSAQSQLHYSTNPTGDAVFYNTYQTSGLDDDDDDSHDISPQTHPVRRVVGKSASSTPPPSSNTNDNAGKGSKNDKIATNDANSFVVKSLSKYDMKNHMANERTFFKYLFTGLHIGSIGTLVLTFFPNEDINKLYLVIFIWLIAFAFMFWGLYGYYKRKHLMEMGKFTDSNEISPHTPLLISCIFVGVILLVVWYGLYVHYKYDNGLSLSKIFMMSEKKTTGRAGKKRNRRRNGGGKRKRAPVSDNDTADAKSASPMPTQGQAQVDLEDNMKQNGTNPFKADTNPSKTKSTQQAGIGRFPDNHTQVQGSKIIVPQTNTDNGEIYLDQHDSGRDWDDYTYSDGEHSDDDSDENSQD